MLYPVILFWKLKKRLCQVRNTQVLFRAPAQPMLGGLPEPYRWWMPLLVCHPLVLLRLKLAVRRRGDGHVSCKRFPWTFEPHQEGDCLECDWMVDALWLISYHQPFWRKKLSKFAKIRWKNSGIIQKIMFACLNSIWN